MQISRVYPTPFHSNNFYKESTLFEKVVPFSWITHCFPGKSWLFKSTRKKVHSVVITWTFDLTILNTASEEACLTPVHSQSETGRMPWRRRPKPRNGSSSWPASSGGSPFSSGWARYSASSLIPYRSPEQLGICCLVWTMDEWTI